MIYCCICNEIMICNNSTLSLSINIDSWDCTNDTNHNVFFAETGEWWWVSIEKNIIMEMGYFPKLLNGFYFKISNLSYDNVRYLEIKPVPFQDSYNFAKKYLKLKAFI